MALITLLVGFVVALIWDKPSAVWEPGFATQVLRVLTLFSVWQWALLVLGSTLTGVMLAIVWNHLWHTPAGPANRPALNGVVMGYLLFTPWAIGRSFLSATLSARRTSSLARAPSSTDQAICRRRSGTSSRGAVSVSFLRR